MTMHDKPEPQVTISGRFPESLVERLDKVAEQIQTTQPGIRVTRSEVIRLATFRGIELLEAEQSGKKKKA